MTPLVNGHIGGKTSAKKVSVNSPEFWLFDGANEVLNLSKDVLNSLGAFGGPFGSITSAMIVQGIKTVQSAESAFDFPAALQRAKLAKVVYSAETQVQSKAEGLFDEVTKAFKLVEGPAGIVYQTVMGQIGIGEAAANKLVGDVGSELVRGLMLSGRLLQGRPEGAMDGDVSKATQNEAIFANALTNAIPKQKEEGIFDDIGNFFGGVAKDIGNVASDGAKLAVGGLIDAKNVVGKGMDQFEAFSHIPVVKIFDTVVPVREQMNATLDVLGKLMGLPKTESAFSNSEGFFDILGDVTKVATKLSQALILQHVFADQYLSTQMARPLAELKEEGFLDGFTDWVSDHGLEIVSTGLEIGQIAAEVL